MNSFDAAVYVGLVLAVVTGFKAGLLRSAVTILAYLIATPIAVWVMSLVGPGIDGGVGAQPAQNSLLFFGIFMIAGMVLGKSMRMALDESIGPEAGIGDRLAGAALGAIRVGLVAITLVLIFDQARAIGPPAGVPDRLATAAAIVGGRSNGFENPATGRRPPISIA